MARVVQSVFAQGSDRGGRARADAVGRYRAGEPRDDCGRQPGAVTVSRGEFVDVSAEVRGIGEDDAVVLRYTTDDGRAVDKPIAMKLVERRAAVRRPAAGCSTSRLAESGLAQNLTYRIEAGDARSLDYAVNVVPAPSILVERIEYDYPPYTGYVDRDGRKAWATFARSRARGSRFTPGRTGRFEKADVDFDADGRRDLPMTAPRGDRPQASFELALRDDRQTPQHASYVLRFTNDEGRTNRDPVKHSIDVEPDFSPEAAIVSPQEKSLDVRLDETVAIEVEARDPDFALVDVRLARRGGGPADDRRAAAEAATHRGGSLADINSRRSAHRLQGGRRAWSIGSTASDIRTPKPNIDESDQAERCASCRPIRRSSRRRTALRSAIRAAAAESRRTATARAAAGRRPGAAEGGWRTRRRKQQDGSKARAGQQQRRASRSRQGNSSTAKTTGESATDRIRAKVRAARTQERRREPGQSRQRQQDRRIARRQSSSSDGESGQQSSQGKQTARRQAGEPKSNGEQTGAGAAGGESSQQGSQPAGTRSRWQYGQRSMQGRQNGKVSNERRSATAVGMQKSPFRPKATTMREAFERIQKHMERNGELKRERIGHRHRTTSSRAATTARRERGTETRRARRKRQQGRTASTAAG